MASAHHITFLDNITITNENLRPLLFDESTGNKVDSNFDILNDTGVTEAQLLSSKSIEHILVGTCTGCEIVVTLQISPDGVNWCDCPLSDGQICTITCTQDVGDCTPQEVDVPLLQYVRLKVGIASDVGTDKTCTVRLHFTLN